MTRLKDFLLHGALPLAWILLVWCALWRDFSVPNVAFGLVLAVLITTIFRMPRLYLSDRFNLWYALQFVVYFLWQVAAASFHLLVLAFSFGKPVTSAIVGVELRTRSDLFMTATSHALSLIPGSLVVDIDRANSILYFHVIDVKNPEDLTSYCLGAQKIEAMILRAAGHTDEYAALRAEEAAGEEQARSVASAHRRWEENDKPLPKHRSTVKKRREEA